jgi:hypothetical protein
MNRLEMFALFSGYSSGLIVSIFGRREAACEESEQFLDA